MALLFFVVRMHDMLLSRTWKFGISDLEFSVSIQNKWTFKVGIDRLFVPSALGRACWRLPQLGIVLRGGFA